MERRTFLTVCLSAIAMSALFYTHLVSENQQFKASFIPVETRGKVGEFLKRLNFRSWSDRLDSDDVEYDEVDVSLLNVDSVNTFTIVWCKLSIRLDCFS